MGTSNKGQWYKLLIDKMDKAIENKYYFEAIFIEYMIIDDRLKKLSALAGVNLIKADGKPKMVGQLLDDLKKAKKKQTLPHWKQLDTQIPLADDKYLLALSRENYPKEKIHECIHVPRKLVNFERSGKSGRCFSKYKGGNSSLLHQVKGWVTIRNHWMHAAGNDALTLEEYESDITPLAIDGASFARELCDVTNRIKNGISQEKRRQTIEKRKKN